MAPEVLGYDDDQETSYYTYEADMWSLGCVIYYVMTRKLPLVGFRSYMKYIRGQIPLPSEKLIQNGVSQSGIDFISMLMTPDRDKRPSAKIALQHEWLYAVTAEKKCKWREIYSCFLFISLYLDKWVHRWLCHVLSVLSRPGKSLFDGRNECKKTNCYYHLPRESRITFWVTWVPSSQPTSAPAFGSLRKYSPITAHYPPKHPYLPGPPGRLSQ